jgi:hypothetical protein
MSESSTVPLPPETPGPPEPPPPARSGRGRRIAVVVAAAALVLAIPVVVFAVRGSWPWTQTNPPPVASASPAVSASPSVTPVTPAPDGRIPLADLKNATLDIPAWPADNLTGLSGRLTFVNGEVLSPPDAAFSFERHIVIFSATYGDVDADGAQETLALVGCVVQGGSEQLIAFDRDAAGNIVTLGTVAATTGDVRLIDDSTVLVGDDGSVLVRVGDYGPCCGDATPVQYQDRGYRWNGHEFRQVSGPTSFPANPSFTETGLTPGELVFGPAVDGVRHGALTVTVSYLRGVTPDHLTLNFSVPDGVQREGANWPPPRGASGAEFTINLANPLVGSSAVYTFGFSRPAALSGGELRLYVRARTAADQGDNVMLADSLIAEQNPFNGSAVVAVRETN